MTTPAAKARVAVKNKKFAPSGDRASSSASTRMADGAHRCAGGKGKNKTAFEAGRKAMNVRFLARAIGVAGFAGQAWAHAASASIKANAL